MVIDLRQIREDKGLSIRQVEYMSGLSRSHISDIEIGKSLPCVEEVCKLAHGLQMEPVNLFTIIIKDEPWGVKS